MTGQDEDMRPYVGPLVTYDRAELTAALAHRGIPGVERHGVLAGYDAGCHCPKCQRAGDLRLARWRKRHATSA